LKWNKGKGKKKGEGSGFMGGEGIKKTSKGRKRGRRGKAIEPAETRQSWRIEALGRRQVGNCRKEEGERTVGRKRLKKREKESPSRGVALRRVSRGPGVVKGWVKGGAVEGQGGRKRGKRYGARGKGINSGGRKEWKM